MTTTKRSARGWQGAVCAGLLAMVLPAAAQEPVPTEEALANPESPALEFRANVPWARLKVEGNPSIDGLSPLRVPGPLAGKFWLSARAPGVELQRGRIQVDLDENGPHIVSFGRAPVVHTLVPGIVIPGLPQMRSHEVVKGSMFVVGGYAALGLTLWANDDVQSARDDRESLDDQLAATTDPVLAAELTERLVHTRAEESHLRDRRDLFLATTAGIWGLGLLDALVLRPGFDVTEADGSSMALTLHRTSMVQAIGRSALFPGLGHEYIGQRKKAFWVGTGGALALSYFLWRHDDVLRAEAGLHEAERRDEAAGTVESAAQLAGRQRELDHRRSDRRTAVQIGVAYWALSLLDTALSFGEPWGTTPVGDAGLGLTVDPAHSALAASLRF